MPQRKAPRLSTNRSPREDGTVNAKTTAGALGKIVPSVKRNRGDRGESRRRHAKRAAESTTSMRTSAMAHVFRLTRKPRNERGTSEQLSAQAISLKEACPAQTTKKSAGAVF
jgi:hypothetical protein